MSQEKSQLENVALPIVEGGEAKKSSGPALPASFSLGQGLKKEGVTSRADTASGFVPSYQSQIDKELLEEKERRVWMEREGMNYDLYLLIKNKLVGEFKEKLEELERNSVTDMRRRYEVLKKTSLEKTISENPELYTPTAKDLLFISENLRFFLKDLREDNYNCSGIFLNSFIHAYFNSVPEEKRKDLKLYLPNTEGLDFIGAELSFGELEVDKAKDHFGEGAFGDAVLKANRVGGFAGNGAKDDVCVTVNGKALDYFGAGASGRAVFLVNGDAGNNAGEKIKDDVRMTVGTAGFYFGAEASGRAILFAREAKDYAGQFIKDNVQITVGEAGEFFGLEASGRSVLCADKAKNFAGEEIKDNVRLTVKEAGDYFGSGASDRAILSVGNVGDHIGERLSGSAKISIAGKYGSIGENRKDDSKIILPDERVLVPIKEEALKIGGWKKTMANKIKKILK